jgi:hypothetical protein
MNKFIPASDSLIASIERNFESKDLDYKAALKWSVDDKKSRCELVKDVLAMANTEGGLIIIGVSEDDSGFVLTGVTEEEAATFETSEICRFIQLYADPPINVHVQKVNHSELLFVVIDVPRFSDTPHLCQKDYPGVLQDRTLYVRSDNNESAPIKSSSDFRGILERAVRNRSDHLLDAMRAILKDEPTNLAPQRNEDQEQLAAQISLATSEFDVWNPRKGQKYSYFFDTVFKPEDFDQYRYTTAALEGAALKATVSYTGWPFLFAHYNRRDCMGEFHDGIEGKIATKDFADNDILDFWRLYADGLFFKRQLPGHATIEPPILFGSGIVTHLAEAIDCMCRLFEDLCANTEIFELRFVAQGTRNRSHAWDTRHMREGMASKPAISIAARHSLADWRAGLVDHVYDMSRDFLANFGYQLTDKAGVQTLIQQHFSRRI